jgi:hypothetical protein
MKGILAILMAGIMVLTMIAPAMGNDVSTTASVGDVPPSYVGTASVNTAPGPETDGTVGFTLVVTDSNGADDISDSGWTADWNSRPTVSLTLDSQTATTKTFTGSDTIPYCTPEATYTASFKNSTSVEVDTDTFNVGSTVGLSLDLSAIAYGAVSPGNSAEVLGDDIFGGTVLTVKSTGNTAIDVNVSATAMTSGSDSIANSNIDCRIDAVGYNALGSIQTYDLNLECDSTENVDLKLNVPTGQASGTYTGSVTFTLV